MDIDGIEEEDVLKNRFGGGGYVFCRMPDADTYIYVAQRDVPDTFDSYEELEGRQGVVIAPFCISEEVPLVFVRPDCVCRRPVPCVVPSPVSYEDDGAVQRERYRRSFFVCHEGLRQGVVRKVVCSRRLRVGFCGGAEVSPVHLFWAACRLHPHCYVSLWWTRRTGCWLVATPESLLASDGNSWTTMALAGTMTADEGLDSVAWSVKNREEQEYVSDFILSRLQDVTSGQQVSDTYPFQVGSLVHLRTDFRFFLKEGVPWSVLLGRLHPTPAVCGVPRDDAQRIIAEAEPTERRYYAGFSGMIGLEGMTRLYVSLRCMELTDTGALLYAGGGLLDSSDEEEEWLETCRKLQPMLGLFGAKCTRDVL